MGTESTDLSMFGELEDAPEDRLVVRAVGHVLGNSAGWFHWGGLSVIFPEFRTNHPKLTGLIATVRVQPKRLCLGIDFYTGEVKIIEAAPDIKPKVHLSLQLQDVIDG